MPAMQIPAVRPAMGIAVLMAAQKVSGLFLVAALGAATFAFVPGPLRVRLQEIWRPVLLMCAALAVLFTLQHLATGYWFFENRQFANPNYQARPRVELFINFDPIRAWQEPFRNNHRDSMLNILFIDMFGDYWRYGIDHYRLTDAPNNTVAWRLFRARFGILTSALFLTFYATGAFVLIASLSGGRTVEDRTTFRERSVLSVLFFSGILMLVIATLPGYAEGKFDIIKWEYIQPFVPLLMIPPASLLDQASIGWPRWIAALGLVSIVVLSMIQSIRFVLPA
jgi:hypothetical protein